jgi:predicted DNA repair protein MutK
MASGIFAVLDDIAALMDDVAVASKLATKKTAGILGDDLAVNAEKATGFVSSRELPVLWAITKGSFVNKLIIIPVALTLSYFFPPAIEWILIIGGFYLAYEGVEKVMEWIFHRNDETAKKAGIEPAPVDKAAAEKAKIKSAVTTDFILSVEIVIIALGTVMSEPLPIKIMTVSVVAIIATVGVYGIVALIVRMDDAGYSLIKRSRNAGIRGWLGKGLVKSLPVVIRSLSIIGTVALLLVSGGIFSHNVHALHDALPTWPSILKELLYGIVAGIAAVVVMSLIKWVGALFAKK